MTVEVDPAAPLQSVSLRHERRRIATNFLAIATSNALTLLVSLFTTIYSRRALGPVAVGQVGWSAAVLEYPLQLVYPALQIIGQRDAARHPADATHLTSLLLTIQLLFALMAYGLIAVLALLNLRGPQVSALLLLQGVGLLVAAVNVRWVLQAHERMVAPSIVATVVTLLQAPVLVALVHGPQDVFIYVVYTFPLTLAGAAWNYWYLYRHRLLRLGRLRPTLAGARKVVADSWPVALSQGGLLLYSNCGAIILGFVRGDEAVGLFTSALKLMSVSLVVCGAMWTAYFPALARAHDQPREAGRIAAEHATLLAWMGLPVAALAWATGRHVVTLLYGPDFAQSGLYFEWLCLNIAVIFINTGLNVPLLAWGFQRMQVKITVPVGLAILALNLVVIPRYGAWGAVATTVGAELAVLFLLAWARRRIGIGRHPMLPIVGPPLLCSAAVAAAIKMLPTSFAPYWWLEAATGAVVLFGCLFAFQRRVLVAALALWRKP